MRLVTLELKNNNELLPSYLSNNEDKVVFQLMRRDNQRPKALQLETT